MEETNKMRTLSFAYSRPSSVPPIAEQKQERESGLKGKLEGGKEAGTESLCIFFSPPSKLFSPVVTRTGTPFLVFVVLFTLFHF